MWGAELLYISVHILINSKMCINTKIEVKKECQEEIEQALGA